MISRNLIVRLAAVVVPLFACVASGTLPAAELPGEPKARSTADYINSVPSRRRMASAVKPVAYEEAEETGHEVIVQDESVITEGEVIAPGQEPATWLDGGGPCCGGCDSGCGTACGPCGVGCHPCGIDFNLFPCHRMISHHAQIDYLLWWRKGSPLPPLVTTGGNDGVLGTGETNLFGGTTEDHDVQSGGRINVGLWLDDCRRWNVGFRYWQLGESTIGFSAAGDGSAGSTLIARPFFNSDPGVMAQDSELINEPGVRSGSINIDSASDVLGGDVLVRYMLQCCGDSRLDFVTGYQFSTYDESLAFNTTSTITATNLTRNVSERFDARNEFHGGLLGLRAQWAGGGWTCNVLGKVGLGNVDQMVTIAGTTRNIDAGGNVTTVNGGLLTQDSNIGVFNTSEFAVVPEVNVDLAYQVSCNMRVVFGYSMIYWSEAVQPGRQIDLTVDPTQGTARPAFAFDSTDYWVQGLNFGLQWDY